MPSSTELHSREATKCVVPIKKGWRGGGGNNYVNRKLNASDL